MNPLLVMLGVVLSALSVDAAQREVGSGQTHTTIQACLNAAVAGDICNVHAGTYNEQLTLPTSGTLADRLTIQRNGSDMVTVQSAATPVVNLNGKHYWTMDGINVTYIGSGTDPRGVNNQHGTAIDYVTIRNLTVTMSGGSGTEGACVYIADGDYVTVTNVTCAVTATMATGQGIDGFGFLYNSHLTVSGNTIYGNASESTGRLEDGIVVSGTDILIENNVLSEGWAYDTHPDGIVFQGDGDRFGNLPARINILRNTVHNFSQGIMGDPINVSGMSEVLIANNVVYTTDDFRYGGQYVASGLVFDGIRVGGGNAALGIRAYNNTVSVPNVACYVLRTAVGSAIELKNNLILTPSYGACHIASTTGVVLDYNYYSLGDSTPITWAGSVYSLAAAQSSLSQESHGLTGASGINADFTAPVGALVRGQGANFSSYFSTDRLNVARPSSPSAWDIGAYQYVTSATKAHGRGGLRGSGGVRVQ